MRSLLFRNVRELLANVVKHARAHNVSVRLKSENASLKIMVEDDGVGFDPSVNKTGQKQGGGFGLFSIEERMSDLGGTFDVRSTPGKGCRVVLTLPVEKSEKVE